MALSLLSYDVTDLCLGKPPLRCLSASSSSVSDAIAALKSSDDPFLSVWNCNHDHDDVAECECLGKISMADVICHLSKDEVHTLSALNSPVSVLLPTTRSLVLHVQPSCRFVFSISQNPNMGFYKISIFLALPLLLCSVLYKNSISIYYSSVLSSVTSLRLTLI